MYNIVFRRETCHFDGLVQDCSYSSALAMELLQSFTKPLIYFLTLLFNIIKSEQTSMIFSKLFS